MGTKNFASLYVGVSIAERIGLNGGNENTFVHFRSSIKCPGFQPTGLSLL